MCVVPSCTEMFAHQGNTENRSVINVSSTSGLHGNVGQANYAAAKSAVIGLTKTLCKEWGPFGVRANTIAFGHIKTRRVSRFLLPWWRVTHGRDSFSLAD